MTGKISVIGDVPVKATVSQGARGAEVLVAEAGVSVVDAARLAPAAVVLVVDGSPDDVASVLDATLWGSHRVCGVSPDDLEGAIAAVAGEGEVTLRGVLRSGAADVTLGRAGVVRVERPA
jgi:hypothetical protein